MMTMTICFILRQFVPFFHLFSKEDSNHYNSKTIFKSPHLGRENTFQSQRSFGIFSYILQKFPIWCVFGKGGHYLHSPDREKSCQPQANRAHTEPNPIFGTKQRKYFAMSKQMPTQTHSHNKTGETGQQLAGRKTHKKVRNNSISVSASIWVFTYVFKI